MMETEKETEKELQLKELAEKERRIKELEERVQQMGAQDNSVAPAVPATAMAPYPAGAQYPAIRPETNYGAIGLGLEFIGLFVFGLIFGIIGLLLGIAGANTKTKQGYGGAAICFGLVEILVTVVFAAMYLS